MKVIFFFSFSQKLQTESKEKKQQQTTFIKDSKKTGQERRGKRNCQEEDEMP